MHEDHGVGRYRKLITMNVSGMPGEFVEIEYAKGTVYTFRLPNCI